MPQQRGSPPPPGFDTVVDKGIPTTGDNIAPPETGPWAGFKRGLSSMNPMNLVSAMDQAAPVTDPQKLKPQAFEAGLQHFNEHPVASALGMIPIFGPTLQSLAERFSQDPSGAITEGATTAGSMMLGARALRSIMPRAMINAQFVDEPPGPMNDFIDAEVIPPQPPPSRTQLGTGRVQYGEAVPPTPPNQLSPPSQPRLPGGRTSAQIQGTAPAQPQLGPAPGYVVPPGTGLPLEADPRLPSSYSSIPAQSPEPPPGTVGKIRLGDEGGIPKRGEQTVTGVKPKPVRETTGRMRKGTPEELLSKKSTPGKTSAEPPKPPPKKKK